MNKDIARNVAEGTNKIANKALDQVDSATEATRGWADQATQTTQKFLESGIEGVNRAQDMTVKKYDQCANGLSKCFNDKPMHSALAFVGIGALLALLLTGGNSRREN